MIKKRKYFAAYTLTAALFCGFICLLFLISHKSMVWSSDGVKQHYTCLAYYGTHLRTILRNIFVEHRFEIPMWDLHIGYGADILTTLHYYTIGDPLNLLSVFVPQRYTEFLYGFLILLRIYLAGAAFSLYCLYHKNRPFPVLLGAMIYISSQWILATGFNHPYFLNPCIYLPLILLGVDKIYAEKKPLLYIGAIAVAGMSNFYFFYMLGIITVIYAVFRYFMIYRRCDLKIIGKLLGRFFLYTLAGLLLACAVLLPVVMTVLGTERLNAKYFVPILYGFQYYKTLPSALIGTRLSRYTIIGTAGISFLSLAVLFMQRKAYAALKTAVVLFSVMLLVPLAGHIMNGFSYVSNRWCWAPTMLATYIFVKMYPEFLRLSRKKRIGLLILTALYACYMFFGPTAGRKVNVYSAAIMALTGIAVCGFYPLFMRKKELWCITAFASIALSMFVHVWGAFAPAGSSGGRINDFQRIGRPYEATHDPAQLTLKSIGDIQAYRYEQNKSSILYNSAMLNGLNGGQFYFSLATNGVGSFFEENYMVNLLEQIYPGINNRSWLMKLFSMKYYVGQEGNVPYGFRRMEQLGSLPNNSWVYEDSNPLPLAYTYDKYLPREEYLKLNAVEKQEAMLQGVVLEESSLPKCQPQFTSAEVPFTIKEQKGVKFGKNGFRVKKAGATCVVAVEGQALCETNLAFTDFKYLGSKNNKRTGADKIFANKEDSSAKIFAKAAGDNSYAEKNFDLRTKRDNFQSGRSDFMLNVGYHEEAVQEIELTFDSKGTYTFEDMQVLCQKMDTLNTWADERNADALQNVSVDGNHITCEASLDESKAVVFSIPYNDGWTLYADGAKKEIKKANSMFMAVELPPGNHHLELHYTTPYLKAGVLLTILGAVLTLCIYLRHRKRYPCK